jgi:hypothetical protein
MALELVSAGERRYNRRGGEKAERRHKKAERTKKREKARTLFVVCAFPAL